MEWCVFYYGVVCILLWSGVYFTMEWCVFYYGIILVNLAVKPISFP